MQLNLKKLLDLESFVAAAECIESVHDVVSRWSTELDKQSATCLYIYDVYDMYDKRFDSLQHHESWPIRPLEKLHGLALMSG